MKPEVLAPILIGVAVATVIGLALASPYIRRLGVKLPSKKLLQPVKGGFGFVAPLPLKLK